jgi:hypothetical protein
VLLFAMGDMLLGRRPYWPIYAAAKHGLAIGIHAGGLPARADVGLVGASREDYVAQSAASIAAPFLAEGVFSSSLAALVLSDRLQLAAEPAGGPAKPGAASAEVPWIDRPPGEIIREHVADVAAGGRAARRHHDPTHAGTSVPTACCCFRPTIRTAIRRRRRAAGRIVRRNGAADSDRQPLETIRVCGGRNRDNAASDKEAVR